LFFLANYIVYLNKADFVSKHFVEKQHSSGYKVIIFDFGHIFTFFMDQQEEKFQSTYEVAACKYVESRAINMFTTDVKNKMYLLFELCDLC